MELKSCILYNLSLEQKATLNTNYIQMPNKEKEFCKSFETRNKKLSPPLDLPYYCFIKEFSGKFA